MSEIKKFSDIENIAKSNVIFGIDNVVATEKLHGTNIGVGYVNGKFITRGRNTIICEADISDLEYGDPVDVDSLKIENDSYGFTRWFLANYPSVPTKLQGLCRITKKDVILFGEFIGSGIQKGVDYGKDKSFWVFDSCAKGVDSDDYDWLPWLETYELAKACGLKRVPVLYSGKPNLEEFEKIYADDSYVAKELGIETSPNVMEGIVIIPANGGQHDYRGNRIIAKFKNDKFAESAKMPKTPKPVLEDNTKEVEFVKTHVTAMRLEHVLQHLREDKGLIVTDMTSTSEVISEMRKDLEKECEGYSELNPKLLTGIVAKNTALLLKEYLFNL